MRILAITVQLNHRALAYFTSDCLCVGVCVCLCVCACVPSPTLLVIVCVCACVCSCVCARMPILLGRCVCHTHTHTLWITMPYLSQREREQWRDEYGVATMSRLLKKIGLFCKRDPQKSLYSAKETYILRSLLIVATP